jgi:hypothetical protein
MRKETEDGIMAYMLMASFYLAGIAAAIPCPKCSRPHVLIECPPGGAR